MTASKPLGTYGDAVGTVTPLDHKLAQSGLIAKTTTANLARAGLFYNGTSTIVSGTANMSYDVAAFSAALTRGATAGTVLMANDATYNVVTTAAPGSNSRYDVVYVWAREFSIDGTDSNPVIGVEQGTAAASPTVPSLAAFPGAIELARILVPAGVTATNSGTTITQKAPFTAASGGIIPFRSTTERDEGTYNEGQLGWLIDTDKVLVYNGSTWVVPGGGAVKLIPTIASTGGTAAVGTDGEVTFSGAITVLRWNVTAADVLACKGGVEVTLSYDGGSGVTGSHSLRLANGSSVDSTASSYAGKYVGGSFADIAAANTFAYTSPIGGRRYRRHRIRITDLAFASGFTNATLFFADYDASGANLSAGTITMLHNVASAFNGFELTFTSMGTIANGRLNITGLL